MTTERIQHSGAWRISALVGGYLVTRVYYFYSQAEAEGQFLAEFPNG